MIYDIHLPVMLALYAVVVGCLVLWYKIKKQKKPEVLLWRCLFSLYLLLVIKVTIFPFTFEHFAWMENTPYIAVQWKPFKSIILFIQQRNYVQIVGNIILFIPFPLLLQGVKEQIFSRGKCFVSVCAASMFVEVIQLGINMVTRVRNHVFDVDDLILNFSGGILLLILYKPLNFAVNTIISFAVRDRVSE